LDEGAPGRAFQWAVAMELTIPDSPLYGNIFSCFKHLKLKADPSISGPVQPFQLYDDIKEKIVKAHAVFCVRDIGSKGRYVDMSLPLIKLDDSNMQLDTYQDDFIHLKAEVKSGDRNLSSDRNKCVIFFRKCAKSKDNTLNLVISYHTLLSSTDKQEEYCICKGSEESEFMVMCDTCFEWFHLDCIKKTIEEAKALDSYICNSCKSENDTKHTKKRKKTMADKYEKEYDSMEEELKQKKNWISLLRNCLTLECNSILQGPENFDNCIMPLRDIASPSKGSSVESLIEQIMKHPQLCGKLKGVL